MVVFGQKWLHSGKSGCIRTRWLYLGKVVVFGQKWLYSDKSGFIRAIRLYSGKNGCNRAKKGSIRAKIVVIGQK